MASDRPVRNVVLPPATADIWEWRLSGACRAVDPTLFFTPTHERGTRRVARENAAKSICRECPVTQKCLEYAIAAGEPHGVWGGYTARERFTASLRNRSA